MKTHWFSPYFKGKKITAMGLGLLGRGVGDILFLAQQGAHILVTDIKTKKQLASSLEKLKVSKNIKYTLGEHKLKDFEKKDFILKAASVPLDSLYIDHAKENNIPVEMSAALVVQILKEHFGDTVTIIGITGTRGKSTTTSLIANLLKAAGLTVHLGGNVRGVSNLPLLAKVHPGDYVVMELDSWQLQGFGEAKISPDIAVFTSFLDDHLNYYKNDRELYFNDKSYIFQFLRKSSFHNVLFASPQAKKEIRKRFASQKIISSYSGAWADEFKTNFIGEHNKENVRLASLVAVRCGVAKGVIRKALRTMTPEAGRLEFTGTINGVRVYDDNNATSPDAVIVALESLNSTYPKSKVHLIMGGADKFLDLKKLINTLLKYQPELVLLSGSGTDRLISESGLVVNEAIPVFTDFKKALSYAFKNAKKGDIVLLSPGFASFGMFINEYDREDQFKKFLKTISK